MTNQEKDKCNEKAIEFLIEDYKLKVDYLSNHFSRILTRFNFFLSIELALFGALGFLLFGNNRNLDATFLPIFLGLSTSILWFAIGCQDRRLVVIYRGGMKIAAEKICKAFKGKDLHGWTGKFFVGSSVGVLDKNGSILNEDDRSFINRFFLFRRRLIKPISVTGVPAIIAFILILLWSAGLVMERYECFFFSPNWEKSRTVKLKVSSVFDGDTIKVEKQGKEITIRLVGLDAPEIPKKKVQADQPFSQMSIEEIH